MLAYYLSRYVNKDRNIIKRFVQHAEKRGIKGLFITVDAPQLGRREKVVYCELGSVSVAFLTFVAF